MILRFFLIFFIFFIGCINDINFNNDKLYKARSEIYLLTTLFYANELFNTYDSYLVFNNFPYQYSVRKTQIIGGNEVDACIDIYISKSFDPNRVITGYESFQKIGRCRSDIKFRCMKDATLFIEVQNFNISSEENRDLVDYCKEVLNGIIIN